MPEGNYNQARTIIEKGLKEAFEFLKWDRASIAIEDSDEAEEGRFEVDEAESMIGRWVMFFETTAPSRQITEEKTFFTYAKGLFCISGDGPDTSMQEWEIRGMMDYAKDKDIFG